MSIKKDVSKNIENSKVYISMVHGDSKCIICGKYRELRLGFCFACADAQSIIADGVDMEDKEDHIGTQIGATQANERLKKLIANGWENNQKD